MSKTSPFWESRSFEKGLKSKDLDVPAVGVEMGIESFPKQRDRGN